jgi:hypothetical protein
MSAKRIVIEAARPAHIKSNFTNVYKTFDAEDVKGIEHYINLKTKAGFVVSKFELTATYQTVSSLVQS